MFIRGHPLNISDIYHQLRSARIDNPHASHPATYIFQMLEYFSLAKCQLAAAALTAAACFLLFVATITPAWQVAEDLDVNRWVQSGLWLYCPGATQCWYIFSDNLINYYEKVDVCRFLLIGDCRKKLLRTPYFFGWHYAVLIMNMITMVLLTLAILSAVFAYWKPLRRKIATILFDVFIFMANLILTIALIVFMANAEMLESKYLIGVKNTFEKSYGYSFYLAGLAELVATFAMLAGVLMKTYTFFFTLPADNEKTNGNMRLDNYRDTQYYQEQPKLLTQQAQLQDGLSTGFHTPMRSSTPMSQLPPLNLVHGEYIPPARSPRGDFIPTTRHFYSY